MSADLGHAVREWHIGGRYLNSKTRQPLTLRYVGPLPSSGGSSSSATWLGVEYDDPANGKGHSGTYDGIQVFRTTQEGTGAFIRVRKGDELQTGPTFVQAIKERYGLSGNNNERAEEEVHNMLRLGGSGSAILVEAPGLGDVQNRLKRLEKLREIGLEDQYISAVGGNESERIELRARLRGVELLDISRSLLSSWRDVADIVKMLPSLKTLILNDSRLTVDLEGDSQLEGHLSALKQLREVHLARSLVTWDTICRLSPALELEELHLSDNPGLLRGEAQKPSTSLANLRVLNLEGCAVTSWTSIEDLLVSFTSLESLNVSSNPLDIETSASSLVDDPGLVSLTNLIILDTPINSLYALARLASRVPSLRTLKHSVDSSLSSRSPGRGLSGDPAEDRHTLIAIFPNLVMLNGTEIRPKERDEAERQFVTSMSRLAIARPETSCASDEWRVYDRLAEKHGLSRRPKASSTSAPEANPQSLKSKLITLHVYPPSGDGFTLTVLPSASVSLLRRKIGRKLGDSSDALALFTVKRTQVSDPVRGENEEVWTREKVASVIDGELGYWFEDGDGVIVE